MNYKEQYREYLNLIERYISDAVGKELIGENPLTEAMKYSLNAGGKRIRPVLLLAFCDIFGVDKKMSLPFAVAVECIHTSSLIHDDMPCLDNDDFRRGKPSCHKAFGEGMAMLAGDALMNYAYELCLKNCNTKGQIAATKYLADSTGYMGMLNGQAYDLMWENSEPNQEKLITLDMLKTGKLIKAPIVMSSLLAEKYEENIEIFGNLLGFMFQFSDDLLDEIGNSTVVGKTLGKDKQSGKITAVSVFGVEKTKQLIENYKTDCLKILENYENNLFVAELVKNLAERDS